MATVTVRYIVDDVDASIDFYREHLGFEEVMHPAPTFAMLARGELRFLLSQPGGQEQPGGGQSLPDGTRPSPGGWNRISIESRTSPRSLTSFVERVCDFAATSSAGSAGTKSYSMIHREIQ